VKALIDTPESVAGLRGEGGWGRGGGETEKECVLWVRVCTRCLCGYIYIYIYARVVCVDMRALFVWVRGSEAGIPHRNIVLDIEAKRDSVSRDA
jgi:hypothetical protein